MVNGSEPSQEQRWKIYLLDPFMNRQVAWDSEYYLGIAVGGYDDPNAGVAQNPDNGQFMIKNYSFFAFYPYLIRAFMIPLSLLRLTPIGTATLAGVIVSLLGTLAGMIALWTMTRDLFDEEGASRAVFYLLIFPTAFFLPRYIRKDCLSGSHFRPSH